MKMQGAGLGVNERERPPGWLKCVKHSSQAAVLGVLGVKGGRRARKQMGLRAWIIFDFFVFLRSGDGEGESLEAMADLQVKTQSGPS
jgi:hypothetical protein